MKDNPMKLVVVIPALNEEASVGTVIRKVPRHFTPDLEVEVLVVNDGSTDRTVEVSLEAGADYVLSFPKRRGLGAAVRTGLKQAYLVGADIAVMIDADDEYPAEYIPQSIAPILQGEADYVLASRFAGRIDGMKLHRRYGNYFFTLLQMMLLRRAITDGQTGFRAFSRQVLKKMDIIHDYNYAQVMTLNIVRQGFRMAEVPIPYKVRTTGTSFIRFWPYVSHVFPAIVKEMRRKPGQAILSDEIRPEFRLIRQSPAE
jgi:glycosyltransferase involved in cell wall biosynthesis